MAKDAGSAAVLSVLGLAGYVG
ncbi:hypothetical protein O9993_20730 [Vibrio lentus]|nr:hypothetical protein [Vibrio lentus]